MPWDNIGSRWVIPGQNLIDLNLEERQYSRQIYHFLNIDKENKLGGKHTVFFKLLLSLLGGPTWSQSLAEIHRIFISLKTNISSGKKKHCLAQGLSAKCLHIRRWLELGFHTQEHDGTVIYTGWSEDFGHTIQVQHEGDIISIYKHNESLLKKTGDKVTAGSPLALVGNSGSLSTGTHLHLELWHKGSAIDPAKYINF